MKTRTLIALLVTIATLVGCDATPLYIGFMRVDGGGAASTSTSTTGGGGGGALLCSPGATQPCYSGPAGTEGQGICEAGTQVCAADGMSWAACSGEVLPGVEDCATAEDEDCDGLAPPCKGSLLWAKSWEGVQATGAAVGPDGAALITGSFGGLVDFGGGPVTAAGPSAGFVVKLDADGHHLWSVPIQGPNVGPTAIAVDAFGTIAIVGFFLGVFDAGGGARAGVADEDVFIVKLDADGHHLWSQSFGGPLTDAAAAVAFDAAGDVLATGYFSTTIDFGGSALMSAGGHDVFLTKLHGADGSSVWSRSFGDAQDQNGSSITADFENNVLVTGDFAGFMDFGGGTLESTGGQDLFVAKLDPSGGYVWAKRFGDIADQWGAAVATDGEGNVAVTGSMMGVVDFGGGVLTSAGGRDTFVVKLGPSGEYLWAKRFGDAADQRGLAMAMDAAGSVVVTGALMGQADFGGPDGPIASVGGADVFVTKLAPNGEYVWAKRFGDTAAQAGAATALTGNGNAVISGVFQGTMDLGGGVQLTSAGTPGAFIAAFGP